MKSPIRKRYDRAAKRLEHAAVHYAVTIGSPNVSQENARRTLQGAARVYAGIWYTWQAESIAKRKERQGG